MHTHERYQNNLPNSQEPFCATRCTINDVWHKHEHKTPYDKTKKKRIRLSAFLVKLCKESVNRGGLGEAHVDKIDPKSLPGVHNKCEAIKT